MKRIIILVCTILGICQIISCTRDGAISAGSEIHLSNIPIEVMTGMSGETKGQDPTNITNISSFGMSAIWNIDSSIINRWFLTSQLVQKEVVDSVAEIYNWNIVPKAYWPLTGTVSFFFYTPFNDLLHPEIQFVDSHIGMPGITYTPVDNVTTQYDLCVSEPLLFRTSAEGPLMVTFDHVLTTINLYANYDGIIPPNSLIIIDSVKFENIYGTKTIYFKEDGSKYKWQDETGLTPDAEYTISRSKNQLKRLSLPLKNEDNDNHIAIFEKKGSLYLLPQELSSEAQLKVYYGLYVGTEDNPGLANTFVNDVKFPEGSVWPMGKVVRLKLTLGVGISALSQIDATIVDWTESNNKLNNGTPIDIE